MKPAVWILSTTATGRKRTVVTVWELLAQQPARLARTSAIGQKRTKLLKSVADGCNILLMVKSGSSCCFGGTMLFGIQIVFASLLIAAGFGVVLLWLLGLALTYDSQCGVMPWTGAGLIFFGLMFVFVGAIVGVPGIVWANNLAHDVQPKWQRLAKAPGLIGTLTLVMGLAVAIVALVIGYARSGPV